MKLRFNKGAIVEICMYGSANLSYISGKVLEVFSDEVQIIPQLKVKKDETEWEYPWEEYERYWTADVKDEVIHVNRQLIRSWKYIKATELGTLLEVNEKSECQLNQYDVETGYCKGEGEYCGEIEEKYAAPVIISISNGDERELEPELEP